MDIEVNYKNKKRYKTAKYPMHQGLFWTWLIWLLSKCALMGKKYKVEKINMEGLKPPYMLLSNHMHFIDFELAAMATYPYPVSNVVSIDGYVIKFFLLEWIGAIATRKFTTDLHLVKSINRQPQQTNSLHVEYNFSPLGGQDFLDISTENDSFYCRPTQENIITKLAFATEEIYLRSRGKSREETTV